MEGWSSTFSVQNNAENHWIHFTESHKSALGSYQICCISSREFTCIGSNEEYDEHYRRFSCPLDCMEFLSLA